MNTDTIIQNTFGQVMTNAAQAMADAAKQYGPDAVELGLIVYRISALQEIVVGLLLLFGAIVLVFVGRFAFKKGQLYAEETITTSWGMSEIAIHPSLS
jgi:succinate-acetate transporter protein